MSVLPPIQTDRLSIAPLTVADSTFIRELVNTKGWLDFIGNRHVYSPDDARLFCQQIIESADRHYFVVAQKETNIPVGIISLVKRDYLDFQDIGFAFLPAYMGLGYAYEAAKAVLAHLRQQPNPEPILATTVPKNGQSIKLLEKLGFVFDKEIQIENEQLFVFKIN